MGCTVTHPVQHKLRVLRDELEDEERAQKRKMTAATDALVAEFKRQMEASGIEGARRAGL